MGLLYPFPASAEETDFISIETAQSGAKKIGLRTYGLPYIFWGYAAASLSIVFFLWLAVQDSLTKLYSMGDPVDQMLVRSLQAFLILLPICSLAFFFYEKKLSRCGDQLKIVQKLFWIPYSVRTYSLRKVEPFEVMHYIDAPNMARIKSGPESVGFQNKGYFTLWAHLGNGKKIMLDRHSRKADLVGIQALLMLGA